MGAVTPARRVDSWATMVFAGGGKALSHLHAPDDPSDERLRALDRPRFWPWSKESRSDVISPEALALAAARP